MGFDNEARSIFQDFQDFPVITDKLNEQILNESEDPKKMEDPIQEIKTKKTETSDESKPAKPTNKNESSESMVKLVQEIKAKKTETSEGSEPAKPSNKKKSTGTMDELVQKIKPTVIDASKVSEPTETSNENQDESVQKNIAVDSAKTEAPEVNNNKRKQTRSSIKRVERQIEEKKDTYEEKCEIFRYNVPSYTGTSINEPETMLPKTTVLDATTLVNMLHFAGATRQRKIVETTQVVSSLSGSDVSCLHKYSHIRGPQEAICVMDAATGQWKKLNSCMLTSCPEARLATKTKQQQQPSPRVAVKRVAKKGPAKSANTRKKVNHGRKQSSPNETTPAPKPEETTSSIEPATSAPSKPKSPSMLPRPTASSKPKPQLAPLQLGPPIPSSIISMSPMSPMSPMLPMKPVRKSKTTKSAMPYMKPPMSPLTFKLPAFTYLTTEVSSPRERSPDIEPKRFNDQLKSPSAIAHGAQKMSSIC